MRRLMIVGAGGHGRYVAEAVPACGQFKLVGFLDDTFPRLSQARDFPVLGVISEALGYGLKSKSGRVLAPGEAVC
jgi:hypothetical protein